jgi:tRNA A37 threonylcarbamoyltransferase TsaD
MNTDGKKLIEGLCERLQDQEKLCTDNQIMILLRSLDRYEVNQLVIFGTVDKWKREKIAKERSLNAL